MDDARDGGDADEPRFHEVDGLQLHAGAEPVVGDVLMEDTDTTRSLTRGRFFASSRRFGSFVKKNKLKRQN